ncbi:MAG: hypothetical protein J5791_00510, partial [Fibrobacter sp.]|nr:hypothetical protein [Fibrobacter sp.]
MKGGNMLYKHWKKIALALTGFFWAGCDDSASSSEVVLYGCPDDICAPAPKSSSDANDTQSSSSDPSTSSGTEISSSSREFGVISSSSFTEVAPAYGVPGKLSCYEDPAGRKYDGSKVYRCDDGATCVEKDSITGYGGLPCSPMQTDEGLVEICPDYGIVAITEKTFKCDDGNVYNEAEFLARYNRNNTVKPTSSSSSDIIPADTLYGVIEPKDDTLDAPIAVYGSPCYFDGTC